jgi:hypothetical protein
LVGRDAKREISNHIVNDDCPLQMLIDEMVKVIRILFLAHVKDFKEIKSISTNNYDFVKL